MPQIIKITFILILSTALTNSAVAQRGYWGITTNLNQTARQSTGKLFRTDSTGCHLIVMHHFADTLFGENPTNSLLLASNGKIYGTTRLGGSAGWGTLFEYDLAIDSFKVLVNFGTGGLNFSTPYDGLIETSLGILYGVAETAIGRIFKYNIATNTCSLVASVPSWVSGLQTIQNRVSGGLYKGSDGFLYGTTLGYSSCPASMPGIGSVFRFNPTNNSFSYIRPFPCSVFSGAAPNGNFVEDNGKFYSTTVGGGAYTTQFDAKGVIFEYNPTANTYTKKFDFNDTLGLKPRQQSLVKAANGKLYGLTEQGGNSVQQTSTGIRTGGVLYEYNPATNIVTKKFDFKVFLQNGLYVGSNPTGDLLAASNGKLYGSTVYGGIFEYDPLLDTLIQRHSNLLTGDYSPNGKLIEVCRKPAYKYFANATYTICAGSFFQFDIQCYNAKSVVWKRNGTVVTNQTTSILNFNSISLSDAGVWTCEMFNECGSTIPVGSVTIAVNTASLGTITSSLTPTGTTQICPGSTAILSGNNGGTWNTGSINATISVSSVGKYQVVNTNTCGNTYSNIVQIDTIPRPIKPIITGPPQLCPNDSIFMKSNVSGLWSTGSTMGSIKILPQIDVPYSLTNTHRCGSDTSNIIQYSAASYYFVGDSARITPLGPLRFCAGDSVKLNANYSAGSGNSTEEWLWYFPFGGIPFGGSQYITNEPDIYAKASGKYLLVQIGSCKITTDTVEVVVDSFSPLNPIVTAVGNATLCDGDSVTLVSNAEINNWSTGETVQSIIIQQAGSYFTTTQNSCGASQSNAVVVTVNPIPPTPSITPSGTNYICEGGSVTLSSSAADGNSWANGGATTQSISVSNSSVFVVRQLQNGCYSLPSNAVEVIVSICTDVNELDSVANMVYPNPSNGKVVVDAASNLILQVSNVLGQQLFEVDLQKGKNEIDLKEFSDGIYYFTLLQGEARTTKKIIKN
jgi:Secretion system C-terminal sorting domain